MSTLHNMLELKQISKSFGGRQVITDVSFELSVGQIQALIGPNGAGKSTLIAMIGGQVKPDAGSIKLDGLDLLRMAPYERVRRGLVRSFQISSVFLTLKLVENIALALLSRNSPHTGFLKDTMKNKQLRDQAYAIAEEFGMKDLTETPAADLSHGGRRLLELAMTLALTPRVLLLDEPMAGLSETEAERVATLIEQAGKSRAVLLVEHDIDMVFRLADKIAVLSDGQLIANDVPDAIRMNEQVQATYLNSGSELEPEDG